ncbi:beta-1,4-galactosyltransferase 1 [Elysia marginata]|uniref:Beta-1,4-galactosyltransferase 1 n=1 Tax=Elysia marginata TaxID=1093978 RepID=A0AAV4GQB3_9GAST|nr:beta-1,4-galactosyltransferase 1 [Elysia marginata]
MRKRLCIPSGDVDFPSCDVDLDGRLATYRDARSFEEIGRANPEVRPGGRYAPSTCTSRHRVAIVVPYRNREEHLKILMRNLHPMLQRQQLDYGIYIIDQYVSVVLRPSGSGVIPKEQGFRY